MLMRSLTLGSCSGVEVSQGKVCSGGGLLEISEGRVKDTLGSYLYRLKKNLPEKEFTRLRYALHVWFPEYCQHHPFLAHNTFSSGLKKKDEIIL